VVPPRPVTLRTMRTLKIAEPLAAAIRMFRPRS
jgi:hypothetical protein